MPSTSAGGTVIRPTLKHSSHTEMQCTVAPSGSAARACATRSAGFEDAGTAPAGGGMGVFVPDSVGCEGVCSAGKVWRKRSTDVREAMQELAAGVHDAHIPQLARER